MLRIVSSFCVVMLGFLSSAHSQTVDYTVVHAFANYSTCDDPNGAQLLQAWDGNLYGFAVETGVLFKVSPAGTYGVVAALPKSCDYEIPALIQGPDGDLYGVYNNYIFKISTTGSLTVLYQLNGTTQGGYSQTSLLLGSDGNFYGTTMDGGDLSCYQGQGCGTLFRLTPAGQLTVLHTFTGGADGAIPGSPMLQASDGNYYGITYYGGATETCGTEETTPPGCGVIYQITASGNFSTVFQLGAGFELTNPSDSAFAEGPDAYLYDYRFSASEGLFKVNYSGFESASVPKANVDDQLSSSLLFGSDANLYGVETDGVYRMTTAGAATEFVAPQGIGDPSVFGTIIQGSDGNFYGTSGGGGNLYGTIYKAAFTPALPPPVQITLSSPTIDLGQPVTLSWAVLNAFSVTMQQCYAFQNNNGTPIALGKVPGTYDLATNQWTGGVTLTPTLAGTYNLALTCGGVESGYATLTVTTPQVKPAIHTQVIRR